METWQDGCVYARDLILSTIAEMQDELGYYANLRKHQAFQEVYDRIVEKYGHMFEDWME